MFEDAEEEQLYWEQMAEESEQAEKEFKERILDNYELYQLARCTRADYIESLIPIDHKKESNYHNYSNPKDRRNIVIQYFEDEKKGKALNQEAWAKNHYNICGRTLRNYIKEFPEIE